MEQNKSNAHKIFYYSLGLTILIFIVANIKIKLVIPFRVDPYLAQLGIFALIALPLGYSIFKARKQITISVTMRVLAVSSIGVYTIMFILSAIANHYGQISDFGRSGVDECIDKLIYWVEFLGSLFILFWCFIVIHIIIRNKVFRYKKIGLSAVVVASFVAQPLPFLPIAALFRDIASYSGDMFGLLWLLVTWIGRFVLVVIAAIGSYIHYRFPER